ncbi:succinate dehydrogenase, hydrophobic membrane anchor protein [Fodinicurvata sp. EGI_FJ10296]|jgi:succinate dehydrogenase / fumarate reductase membrane anchor subunit|uniref:succinate dehydrogenase, hydrophobic membrane anchor protein n=1 Tax=Fodinicurvata sp. EGI_FJ10296 TaxID=3231908 RepID=UPI0034526757
MSENNRDFRSALSRVRGLGSAKSGTGHWWSTRLSSLALIPLGVWFVVSLLGLIGAPHATVVLWMSSPFVAVMLILLIVATFHHAALGMQTVYEDYIHDHTLRLMADLGTKGLLAVFAVATIIAVIRTGLGG